MKTQRLTLPLALTGALLFSGCLGQGDDKAVDDDMGADEVLALAKEKLDETSGVELSLSAEDLPSGISGIVLTKASGTAVHPNSFEGDIVGSLSGITQDGQVISVDGTVWVKIALLGPEFEEMDPATIGAPDPGQLIATEGGLSDLLVATEDAEKGETVRGGSDNSEVLTEFTGTLPGEEVTFLVPNAAADDDFDVAYQIAENGEMRQFAITGVFYPDTDPMTYRISFEDYGTEKEITAP